MPRDLLEGLSSGPRDLLAEKPKGPSEASQYGAQFLSGGNEGIANTLGLPVDLATGVVNMAAGGINKATGSKIPAVEKPFLGSDQIKEALSGIGAIAPRSRDRRKQIVRRVGQGIGETAPFAAGTASTLGSAVKSLAYGASSGAGGAAGQQLSPDDPTAELIGSVLGGLSPALVERTLSGMKAASEARKATPTSTQLKETAATLYDDAEVNGFTAKPFHTRALNSQIKKVADGEGIVTPKSGEVAETMPKVRAAMRMVDEFAGEQMTPTQMQTVRKSLQNAAGSMDASEARIGRIMLDKFDDFAERLAPQFKDAKGVYRRAKKAETLEQLRELAGSRAGQFTGSGFENALRTEYRGLERQIIKGQSKGWTKEEVAAIRKVAQGTKASNAARSVGRLAPKGPVSLVPTLAGAQMGGPLGAAGVAGLGYGGRALATRLGIEAADTAELLVRAGVYEDKVQKLTQAQREALAAVLAAQANDREASNPQERP